MLLLPAVPVFRPEKLGVALFPANKSRKETHCRLSFSDDCNADPGVPHWGGGIVGTEKERLMCDFYVYKVLLFQFGISELPCRYIIGFLLYVIPVRNL